MSGAASAPGSAGPSTRPPTTAMAPAGERGPASSDERLVLHQQEQQGGDEEAGGGPGSQRVRPQRRRPDEQCQRGGDGADRGASPEREGVRGRGHEPRDE